SNGTNVFSCPLGGGCGAGKVIFTGPTNPDFVTGAIAVPPAGTYGDRLFVATGNWAVSNLSGGLYSVPRAGGAATAINSGEYPFTSVAFDASAGLLYYAEEFGGSPQTGAVYREPLDASTSVMLSQSTRVLGPLAMDGANLYVGSRGLGEVLECPLGSASCTGISESLSPTALFADGTALWVTESSPSAGYVYRCTSSAPCLFTTPAFATTTGPLGGIVSDGTRVYWAHQGGTEVMSCPVSGCVGAPSVVGGVAPGPTSVAVDATAVYWVDSLGVRKIAK
ncbi:MAG TPA: hypothetical protein VIF09_12165, partial [Polyangiaceae bacterium]